MIASVVLLFLEYVIYLFCWNIYCLRIEGRNIFLLGFVWCGLIFHLLVSLSQILQHLKLQQSLDLDNFIVKKKRKRNKTILTLQPEENLLWIQLQINII